jgi:hypothetical protein
LENELNQKVYDYITTLEKTNEVLIKTLKYCVAILAESKPSSQDPKEWQQMLNRFQETINLGEKIISDKTTD